jgi:hypothetical protein
MLNNHYLFKELRKFKQLIIGTSTKFRKFFVVFYCFLFTKIKFFLFDSFNSISQHYVVK